MSTKREIENRSFVHRPHKSPMSKGAFNKLLRQHFPNETLNALVLLPKDDLTFSSESDKCTWAERFFELVDSAFLRASLRTTYAELEVGPDWEERAERLRKIAGHIAKLYEALTGSEVGEEVLSRAELSDRLFFLYQGLGQADLVNSFMADLRALWTCTNSAENSARELHAEDLLGRHIEKALPHIGFPALAEAPENRPGRPIGTGDNCRNNLILEMVKAWEAATESQVTYEVTHPFFGFLAAYFEGEDEYAAPTVSRQLRELEKRPAK